MPAPPGFDAAVSGLNAARTRLAVSASNVANVRSAAAESGQGRDGGGETAGTGFRPQRAVMQPGAGGGVRAETVPVQPASVPHVHPGAPGADADGIVDRPNVSLVQETVTRIEARAHFSANLAAVETVDETRDGLLDVTG